MSANKNPMDRLIEEIGQPYPGSSLEYALYHAEESYRGLLEALKAIANESVKNLGSTRIVSRAAIAKAEGA